MIVDDDSVMYGDKAIHLWIDDRALNGVNGSCAEESVVRLTEIDSLCPVRCLYWDEFM